ncbi:MAG TPA: diaminopimelate epimerase, partial [Candidatus Latescibacteria bacterium]|nr:diaminopimelate epimerase [Candidatus Latescibacterota bacterium]
REWGAELENNPMFPNRTNVQFAQVLDERTVDVRVWERGAGETQASGSSSCAAASAAVRLGLVKAPVKVNAPGGTLRIDLDADYNLTMEGAVDEVGRGKLSSSFVRELKGR